jgi:hypothetical protein
MKNSIETTSSIISRELGIDISKKNSTALATLLSARAVIGSNRSSKYSKAPQDVIEEFNSVYSKELSPRVDNLMANAVGARVVPSRKFKGTMFDNIHTDETGRTTGKPSETKTINVEADEQGGILSASGISIATGSGINLATLTGIYTEVIPGQQVITNEKGEAQNVDDFLKEEDASSITDRRFLNKLVKLSGNQQALKKFLSSNRSVGATLLRKNFMLKASEVHIPIVVAGVPKYKSLQWSWEDIVENKEAKIMVTKSGSDVYFNIKFSSKLVVDMLKIAQYENFKFTKEYSAALATSIAGSLAGIKKGQSFLLKELAKKANIDFSLIHQPGSILVYEGAFIGSKSAKTTSKSKPKNVPKPQKFISSAQWTYLVQKRLGDSMLSFGEPEPPDIKERSGRFRRSVNVTANYRTKTIQYNYNPLYRSLEHYGYHPELQVERSIRQVAQDLYAREFSIIRRGGLA